MKIELTTYTFRKRNFFHLMVGGVYGKRRLVGKQLVDGGCRLSWRKV